MASSTPYLDSTLSSLSSLNRSSPPSTLLRTSDALLGSFRQALRASTAPNMLPSYTSALPTGTESGTAVAVDLGGSTLRVAVIKLKPHPRLPGPDQPNLPSVRTPIARGSWLVDDATKLLAAAEFFDWMAAHIAQVLREASVPPSTRLPLGVTWSFPVSATSASSGLVQEMGKGYALWREIKGTELGAHIEAALRRHGLSGLRMAALMNDTEATLLSHAYANPATRISLIWGTGLNAAVFLPLAAIGREKLGDRPPAWLDLARAAVVNTEVSMFGGGGVLPLARADTELDAASSMPGFQPLEQLTSGRYLGEIARRVLLAAVRRGELFAGRAPGGMEAGYTLDTAIASAFETDATKGMQMLVECYDFQNVPTEADAAYVRRVCEAISSRAALLLALTVFTLYRLQRDTHPPRQTSAALLETHIVNEQAPVAVAYCGAVAEKHATARVKCQEVLDLLVEEESKTDRRDGLGKRRLVLEGAADSGLLGAAVGAVMNDGQREIRAKL